MTRPDQHRREALQERLALRIAARLSEGCDDIPHDISERLRFARSQALDKRKLAGDRPVAVPIGGAAATLGALDERANRWTLLGASLALVALILGLVTIHAVQDERFTQEMARVDAALLTDDLPVAAYADPGFSQFLKLTRAQSQ